MKRLFYLGIIGLLAFEILNIYFIMPMPGSQEMESIAVAFFLHSWRWIFRGIFFVVMALGAKAAFLSSRAIFIGSLMILCGMMYVVQAKMAADKMFLQPTQLIMASAQQNKVPQNRLVIGVVYHGQAKAYPIQFLAHHHQVLDTLAGKPIMVTYCSVCRTGRVFEPLVQGKTERFRLVGMDHFNAMFEDATTHSWWRQATGEAIAGDLKGKVLPEFPSNQVSLAQWLTLHPNSFVMQPDPAFDAEYSGLSNYEAGERTGALTRRDSLSWQRKSWIIGVVLGNASRAYDWNALAANRILYDTLNQVPIALIVSDDSKGFVAVKRSSITQAFILHQDTLIDKQHPENRYSFLGESYTSGVPDAERLPAYQEYWHSWQTFHPKTSRY